MAPKAPSLGGEGVRGGGEQSPLSPKVGTRKAPGPKGQKEFLLRASFKSFFKSLFQPLFKSLFGAFFGPFERAFGLSLSSPRATDSRIRVSNIYLPERV